MRAAILLLIPCMLACGATTGAGGFTVVPDALLGDQLGSDAAIATDAADATSQDTAGTVDTVSKDVSDVAIDAAVPPDVSADTGSTANKVQIDVSGTVCWTLATGSAQVSSTCQGGDIVLMVGANIDLQGTIAAFCPLPGTFTSVASIPADYSNCAWTQYIEGMVGLADTGYIVRDAAALHHWKMRIISNTLPTFIAELVPID